MLRFELDLSIDSPSLDEATLVLRSLVGTVRSEPGCGATRLLRDLDDPGHLTFIAEWRSRADLQRHLGSAAFRKILAVMELASREPVVEIDEIASRRGFDLVEETLGDGRRVRERV